MKESEHCVSECQIATYSSVFPPYVVVQLGVELVRRKTSALAGLEFGVGVGLKLFHGCRRRYI
jgi:hypothetical protein